MLGHLLLILATAQTPIAPDDLLQRGRDNYRAAHYTEAVTDLSAAADAFIAPEQMQSYVTSGQLPPLEKFETALVYLALSYARLGKNAEAGEQVRRLVAAEAIAP